MVKTAVTEAERAAARESGQINPKDFDKESKDQQDEETIEIEELAALYVSVGGDDPRAMKLFQAAKAAGRIDSDGNWVDQE